MSRRFDDVTAKDGKNKEATIQCTQKDFDPSKGHGANASVAGRTLTVTATIGDKEYRRDISDVDIQPAVKVQKEKKHVIVTVTKTADFKMTDKL